ncbi:alanine--tRNA ligase [Streptomyces sp. SAI-229]
MESAEIRRRWLSFFEERGHTVVPSASLIADDPTLLLVPAGMVPFKPYFLGEVKPPFDRATSVQKCVRTPDIEEVGKTTRHGTFFQMCGNFSFGDYFKEGAIKYAWELLTSSQDEGGYGLDPERLWITVYQDDDEAERIWHDVVGVPSERIQRLGKKDNYWDMGVPGPCGPCSEINYDRGPEFGAEGGPAVNDERYVEIWNLVFMQYERGEGPGKDYPILGDLPSQNIDTGLGLERLAMILQGVQNMYEIDTSMAVINKATELTGVAYGDAHASDVSLRVVTDHMRTSVMLIGDGVTPGNEGRGYVLRRIMRRAIRNMRLLGATGPVVKDLVDVVIGMMGQQYPELITDRERIEKVALAEENAFLKTLKAGTNILDTAVSDTKAAGGTVLAGDKAFLLHDTWGFPIDLTLEMAAEQGLSVDEEGFRRLMKEQRERAKADAQAKKTGHADMGAYREIADRAGATDFIGYTDTEGESTIVGILVDGVSSPRRHRGRRGRDRPRPHPVLRRGRRPDRRHRPHQGRHRCRRRDPRLPEAGPGRVRPQGRRPGRRGHRRRQGPRLHRRPPPHGHRPRPLGHPPHPPGPARRPRPDGRPGRFREPARPLPLRLRLPVRRTDGRDDRRRAEDQRGARPRPRRPRRRHGHRRGQETGRHRRVRREVRRARARGHHR